MSVLVAGPLASVTHALDPLSLEEIVRACSLLKTIQGLGSSCRFAMVQLQEPAKE